MSNDVIKFVFSTRFLGEGFAFAASEDLADSSAIRKYLKERFFGKNDDLWECIKKIRSGDEAAKLFNTRFGIDIKEKFGFEDPASEDDAKEYFISFLNDGNTDTVVSFFLEQGIVGGQHLGDFNGNNILETEMFAARFKYFVTKDSEGITIDNVYAVSHLGRGDKEWIEALVNEKFEKNDYVENAIWLVLHDNDVPGFASTPFKYLTAQEIFNLLGDVPNSTIKPDADGEDAFYLADGRKLCIIVFQHTWNDVVSLLTRGNSIYDEIKNGLMIGNRKSLREFFASDYYLSLGKPNFSKLTPKYSVDSCYNRPFYKDGSLLFEEKELPTRDNNSDPGFKKIRIYSDCNGALLTELMHVRTNVNSSSVLRDFIKKLRAPSHIDDEGKNVNLNLKKMCFPLIIKTYKDFFADWEEATDDPEVKKEIRIHRNKKALGDNLERVFSLFNNSSIFVRLVDICDSNAEERAINEFKYFDSIGLYDYDSAWENLEYKTRIFAENYLNTAGASSSFHGHGDFVTPLLFGDESEALDDLTKNLVPFFFSPDSSPQKETPKESFWDSFKKLFNRKSL